MIDERYKFSDLTGRVIGCAMEVHRRLGVGFPEVIYQRALSLELTNMGIQHEREVETGIMYRHERVGTRRVDLMIDGKISVELKAVSQLEDIHLTQAINYLESYPLEIGLLINFGAKSLQLKRVINSKNDRSINR